MSTCSCVQSASLSGNHCVQPLKILFFIPKMHLFPAQGAGRLWLRRFTFPCNARGKNRVFFMSACKFIRELLTDFMPPRGRFDEYTFDPRFESHDFLGYYIPKAPVNDAFVISFKCCIVFFNGEATAVFVFLGLG